MPGCLTFQRPELLDDEHGVEHELHLPGPSDRAFSRARITPVYSA